MSSLDDDFRKGNWKVGGSHSHAINQRQINKNDKAWSRVGSGQRGVFEDRSHELTAFDLVISVLATYTKAII